MNEQRVYDREPKDRLEAEPAPDPARAGDDIFNRAHREDLRRRWLEIQSSFIDEPRLAVDRAEELVRELLTALSDRLEASRGSYEGSRDAASEPSTESLRRALQGYRSLFDRIVAL